MSKNIIRTSDCESNCSVVQIPENLSKVGGSIIYWIYYQSPLFSQFSKHHESISHIDIVFRNLDFFFCLFPYIIGTDNEEIQAFLF